MIKQEKQYGLEERCFCFAKEVREFCAIVPKSMINIDDMKQLLRSSGSVGANFIESCEALSKKDFPMRIKICRKEAKESVYWIRLVGPLSDDKLEKYRLSLLNEAQSLMKIFGSIVTKN
ncbi:four helix bundle protein [Candidatus Berkelbacteria bacterium CG2_30_43_20]|uniref:Four helix bundle protein n=1 Tax=Candidatus Berkelbacteria bacterium CG10_big_fil_rev_8_21_14_0_10_43_14 TaxID=1974515 RepID=A0A2M6R8U8_9BACT|nr:MAG: four helix bundle protein [Candidatus Berkelbacteria bacterium CG2_30_43_20]PIS07054.1 MAG: four helix bundle protein [Candidatus Berkelbacteria bacterium CG10_big_fil_rev_8_21_14_0_10_43_14]